MAHTSPNTMRHITILILAIVLAIVLLACGPGLDPVGGGSGGQGVVETTGLRLDGTGTGLRLDGTGTGGSGEGSGGPGSGSDESTGEYVCDTSTGDPAECMPQTRPYGECKPCEPSCDGAMECVAFGEPASCAVPCVTSDDCPDEFFPPQWVPTCQAGLCFLGCVAGECPDTFTCVNLGGPTPICLA